MNGIQFSKWVELESTDGSLAVRWLKAIADSSRRVRYLSIHDLDTEQSDAFYQSLEALDWLAYLDVTDGGSLDGDRVLQAVQNFRQLKQLDLEAVSITQRGLSTLQGRFTKLCLGSLQSNCTFGKGMKVQKLALSCLDDATLDCGMARSIASVRSLALEDGFYAVTPEFYSAIARIPSLRRLHIGSDVTGCDEYLLRLRRSPNLRAVSIPELPPGTTSADLKALAGLRMLRLHALRDAAQITPLADLPGLRKLSLSTNVQDTAVRDEMVDQLQALRRARKEWQVTLSWWNF